MRSYLLFVFLLLSWPADAARILVLGDSLSDAYNIPREQGWVSLLEVTLGAQHEVVNASVSGETTAGGAARIGGLLDTHRPDLLLVILGGNDGLRGLDPGQVSDNLAAIIEAGQSSGATVLLMQIRIPPNLGPAYVERFEAVYPQLTERFGLPLLPFFLEDIFDQPGMMMDDGVHPTAPAQPLMLERVLPEVEKLLR